MYSPAIADEHIRPLYRLARVRGCRMTHIINSLVDRHLNESKDEIADYDPAIHDRARSGKSTNRIAQA